MQQEAFEKLIGRAATAEEAAKLFRIKEAMGISDRDPFWLILLVLEYYKSLYDGIPEKIRSTAQGCAQEIEASLTARLQELREATTDLHAAPELPTQFSFEFSDEEMAKVIAAVRLALRDQQEPILDAIHALRVPSLDPVLTALSGLDALQQQIARRQMAFAKQLQTLPAPERVPVPWWGRLLATIAGSSILTVGLIKGLMVLRLW